MKRLQKKAEQFNLYNYWSSRQDELKKLIFDHINSNLDYLYTTNSDRKYQKIQDSLWDMDEMDLEMALETYLINHNEDLYNSIIESADRPYDDFTNIDYNSEFEDVTRLLRDLFSNSANVNELANVLDLKIED